MQEMSLASEHGNWGSKILRARCNQLNQAIRRAVLSMEVSVPLQILKLQCEVEQNAPNFDITHKGKGELKFPFKSAGTFHFNFSFRNACTLNRVFFLKKPKFEISYFNSGRMQFPSQLSGLGTEASILNNELDLSSLTGGHHCERILPFHSILLIQSRTRHLLCCTRLDQALGEDTELLSLLRAGRDFESNPGLMDLACIPHCWRIGQWAFQPLSLSDGNCATNVCSAQKGIK